MADTWDEQTRGKAPLNSAQYAVDLCGQDFDNIYVSSGQSLMPGERQRHRRKQSVQGQVDRLTTVQNCLGDVRGKERKW